MPARYHLLNQVSVLFNEPKLLKSLRRSLMSTPSRSSFSALQRAEIAEIRLLITEAYRDILSFSALQRAEIAEMLPK